MVAGESSLFTQRVTAAQRVLGHDSKQLPECLETQLFELLLFPNAVFQGATSDVIYNDPKDYSEIFNWVPNLFP